MNRRKFLGVMPLIPATAVAIVKSPPPERVKTTEVGVWTKCDVCDRAMPRAELVIRGRSTSVICSDCDGRWPLGDRMPDPYKIGIRLSEDALESMGGYQRHTFERVLAKAQESAFARTTDNANIWKKYART